MPITTQGIGVRDGQGGWILRHIDLTVPDESITLIIGRNGAGKSTLLEALTGLIPLAEGAITYDREPLWASDKRLNSRVLGRLGQVFQYPEQQLFASTVRGEFTYSLKYMKLAEVEVASRTSEAMALMELPSSITEESPHLLSGGQKRRLALATTMATHPDWLMLDEPTAGLDAQGVQALIEFLLTQRQQGRSMVIATHDIETLLPLADRIILVHCGSVAAIWTREEILSPRGADLLEEAGLLVPSALMMMRILSRIGGAPRQDRLPSPQEAMDMIVRSCGKRVAGSSVIEQPADRTAMGAIANAGLPAEQPDEEAAHDAIVNTVSSVEQPRDDGEMEQADSQQDDERSGGMEQADSQQDDERSGEMKQADSQQDDERGGGMKQADSQQDDERGGGMKQADSQRDDERSGEMKQADSSRSRDSYLSKLDPRAKWLFYMFLSVGILIQGSWTGFVLGSVVAVAIIVHVRVPWRPLLLVALPLVMLIIFSILVSGISLNGGFRVDLSSSLRTVFELLKILIVSMFGLTLATVTSQLMMKTAIEKSLRGLRRLRIPVEAIALGGSLMLRFIPLFMQEYRRFGKIVKARAKDRSRRNGVRLRQLPVLFTPMIISLLQIASDLTTAMQARGLTGFHIKRTSRVQLRMGSGDWMVIILGILILILLVLIEIVV